MVSRFFGVAAGILVILISLSGCGFHLRGSGGDLSYSQRLYVEGTGASGGFLGAFSSAVTGAGGGIVRSPVDSSGVVHLYQAVFRRQPITLSRTGRATGYDLVYRVVYDIRTPKGEILQSRKEFEVKRDYFNDQSFPLAQLAEESQIREEIEKEAAQALLRRVVAQLSRAPAMAEEPARKL